MTEILKQREEKIREFFNLQTGAVRLLRDGVVLPEITPEIDVHLKRFNIEWHIIPAEDAMPLDEEVYRNSFYATRKGETRPHVYQKTSSYRAIINGHRRHQGRIIGVETTMKPRYLPGNRQFYGTHYGFEAAADPFARYFGAARMVGETRYGHNYASLRAFVNLVNDDWKTRGLMPPGYRLTICPPVVFNFVGTIFHKEWSQSESLELGFYRDDHGNAKCYAVGSNAPDDFSYLYEIATDSDWTLLGFRIALVPDES
jgi:hypothetical protein